MATDDYVSQDRLTKDFDWGDIELRPYQLEGVNWLYSRFNKGHGCILGDEMGLGKTCQTIALLTITLNKASGGGPHLVITPRSVLENWAKEFERFSPKLRLKLYIGDKEERSNIAREMTNSKGHSRFDVLLTTYEMCLKDDSFLKTLPWNVMVIDEAHRLKNHESLLYTTLEQWLVKSGMRILLTGTPVQNNLRELYALLSFVDCQTFRLSKLKRFVEKYSMESQDVKELLEVMEPYLLRRTKSQVLFDLPDKTDIVLYHGLSALQKKLYKAILTKDIGVFETNTGGSQTRLLNVLMQLRKCVNHPYLFDGVEEEPFEIGDHLVDASSKLCLIDALLDCLHQAGHKVLMFSQMARMLDILQDYLGYRGYSYERLDGSVRGEERFLAVENFNQNEDTFVFLLSTKAGGQGLNLTSADTVIFVDSDYNPQNDLQAAARAHRIGQDRPVKIIRLIGRNTIEEIILRRAEDKLKLTEKVIESGHFGTSSKGRKMMGGETSGQLQEILKFGVDDLLNEAKSDETIDFESILGRSEEGKWVVEDKLKRTSTQEKVDEIPMETESQSMYHFEGTDYSKQPSAADVKAFEQLIKMEKEALETTRLPEKTLRRTGTNIGDLFGSVVSKTRKPLTAEQLEERKKKMKEAAEQKAKLAEERKLQRIENQKKKRQKLWNENGYVSKNIILDSDGEEEEEDEDDFVSCGSDDEEMNGNQGDERKKRKKLSLDYVIGDVTQPQQQGDYDNIVIHCVDDSGSWGRGGVFSVLSACSSETKEAYELAGTMDDLNLGDCHLLNVTDGRCSQQNTFWVALIVAQHRDKKNQLSGIGLTPLQQGLQKVFQAAKEKHACVHLPRIGHDTPKFNWYATERMIRKHLSSKGIPTFIYYFPRKTSTKRKGYTTTISPTHKVSKKEEVTSPLSNIVTSSTTNDPSTSMTPSKLSNNKVDLVSIFSGLSFYFHNVSLDDKKKLSRFVIAYDGDIHQTVSTSTTHIIVNSQTSDIQEMSDVIQGTKCQVVLSKWLDKCIAKKVVVPCDEYTLPA